MIKTLSSKLVPNQPCRFKTSSEVKRRRCRLSIWPLWALQRGAPPVDPLSLSHPSGKAIAVFGVEHLRRQAGVAEYILAHKPSSVVVETALDFQHGTATGNAVRIDDATTDFSIGMFQQLGRQLSWEFNPMSTDLWQSLKPSCGEQLVYIAAFVVGANVVFGDRPKHDTYLRLHNSASLVDLDYAYGVQSWQNYQELLDGRSDLEVPHDEIGVVDTIMLSEREAIFCESLDQAAQAGTEGVVGVVGEAHLSGIKHLWETSSWRQLCDEMDGSSEMSSNASSDTVIWTPESQTDLSLESKLSASEMAGVKHALLQSVMRLKTVPSVVADLKQALPVAEESWEPYCWAHELYASPRMLLASLSREQLAQVCCGWKCDMWEILQPLRSVRPVNGGTGLAVELTIDLRSLDLMFQ